MAGAAGRRLRGGEHRAAGVPAVSWRLSFYDGWLVAVQERLTTARARALRAVDAVPADRGSDQRRNGTQDVNDPEQPWGHVVRPVVRTGDEAHRPAGLPRLDPRPASQSGEGLARPCSAKG